MKRIRPLIFLVFIYIVFFLSPVLAFPMWSDNSMNVVNGSNYSTAVNYGFEINWTDSVTGFDNATFQLGIPDGTLTNYTTSDTPAVQNTTDTWYINFTQYQIGKAGTYNFTWYGINTTGTENVTDTWTYVINKAGTNTTLYLNGTSTDKTTDYYHYGNPANLTVDLNVSDTVELWTNFTGTYALWKSGSDPLINYTNMNYVPGLYNVSGNFTENENYTSSFDSHILTIWGYAEINESSHASSVRVASSTQLACRVRENTSTSPVNNYNVSFWDNSTGFLGSDLTNSTGWANISTSWGNAGAYNVTCNITANVSIYYNVSESYFNFSIITSTSAPSTTTTAAGGGGGGGGTPGKKLARITHIFKQLNKNVITKWKINQPGLGLIEMNMTVQNPANNVKIIIQKTDGRPASVVHEVSGKVYHYIEITKTNLEDTDIDKIKLKINVNKSWISDNNIDENTVALNRYHNNAWEKLPTSEVEEDDDYVYYVAEMTGLSVFAVTGEEKTAVTTTVPTTVATTVPTTVATTVPIKPVEEGISTGLVSGVVLVIVIIVILVAYFSMGKQKKHKKTVPK